MLDRVKNAVIPRVLNPNFWKQLLQETRLAWYLYNDPRVPQKVKWIPTGMMLYIVSPFDIIPGFIPILGQMDDLALFILGIKTFIRRSPPDVVAEHRAKMGWIEYR